MRQAQSLAREFFAVALRCRTHASNARRHYYTQIQFFARGNRQACRTDRLSARLECFHRVARCDSYACYKTLGVLIWKIAKPIQIDDFADTS